MGLFVHNLTSSSFDLIQAKHELKHHIKIHFDIFDSIIMSFLIVIKTIRNY